MGAKMVNTVTGPVSVDDLGLTLMHEHIVFGYPGWNGDVTLGPFDRQAVVESAVRTLAALKAMGLGTVVDATPNETGRDPLLLKEVSEKSGVNIICATGYYSQTEGGAAYFAFRAGLGDAVAEITEMFLTELTKGIAGTGVKPGVLKLASSQGQITDYEKMFFTAAVTAQKQTATPIITHTEHGTMGPEQAKFLLELGAEPKRTMIGHMSDNLDLDYQEAALKQGVYVSWDRMGLQGLAGCPMEAQRYPVLNELIKRGWTKQLMLSHDSITAWLGRPLAIPEAALPLVADWRPDHIFNKVVPALLAGGASQADIDTILKDNPRRLFAGE